MLVKCPPAAHQNCHSNPLLHNNQARCDQVVSLNTMLVANILSIDLFHVINILYDMRKVTSFTFKGYCLLIMLRIPKKKIHILARCYLSLCTSSSKSFNYTVTSSFKCLISSKKGFHHNKKKGFLLGVSRSIMFIIRRYEYLSTNLKLLYT